VWLANLDTIEFHPWYSRINPDGTSLPTIFINSIGTLEMSVLNYPDWLVIDVDANQEDTQLSDQVQQGALLIHDYLQQRSIAHAAKVSGQGGLHIVVPIQRLYPYEQVRQAARRLCQQVADQHDELFTTEWHMDKRQGRIFLDWQQNARGKSLVAPYSLRATPEATVSWPISWDILASQEPFHPTLLTTPKVEDDAWDNQTPQELPAEWLT
jgi:bifunctional non-homologous end joining protein LigD